ncbi:MAG TPA: SpoIIE family protein phosphatase [Flavobacteriales bacterium]|nr:SpoIIE family protein phosphatase [Flavobacteriales bacterium]
MKKNRKYFLFSFVFLFLGLFTVKAQEKEIDSVDYFMNSKRFSFEQKFDRIFKYTMRLELADAKTVAAIRKLNKTAGQKRDSLRMARANYLIGKFYGDKENYLVALDYYYAALPYAERHKDTNLLLEINNKMGIAFSNRRQHKKAAEFFEKNMKLLANRKNKSGLAISSNNAAIEYIELKQFQKAEKNLRLCYRIMKEMKLEKYVSTVVMNLGVVRFGKRQYDSALYYYRWAASMEKQHDNFVSDNTSNNLGDVFYHLRQYDSALYYLQNALKQTDTLNAKYTVKETYKHLSNVHHAMGNDQKAYYYLKKYMHLTELIFDDESVKKTAEDEANFNFLKMENAVKLHEQKMQLEANQNRARLIWVSIGGLLLMIALGVVFYRFREKKKDNAKLEAQKNKIEHQQKEITDSISYAKRIQDSILPSHSVMQRLLGEHVLFYMPKDIVGGDFYFVERVQDKKYFAVIDCTGHGVPGGFMSMLGYNALNNALLDLKIEVPGKILDCLSQNLTEHFTQEGKQTLRDGMDMALCCLYEKNGKYILEYAGAHNPCWIIKHTTFQVIELTPSKQPIGYFENYKPFETQTLELEKGDMVYLFSDGYADQFGGPKGKKFKYSQMKTVLQQYAPTGIQKQEIIAHAFHAWKGNHEQMDDVCILGVRI